MVVRYENKFELDALDLDDLARFGEMTPQLPMSVTGALDYAGALLVSAQALKEQDPEKNQDHIDSIIWVRQKILKHVRPEELRQYNAQKPADP